MANTDTKRTSSCLALQPVFSANPLFKIIATILLTTMLTACSAPRPSKNKTSSEVAADITIGSLVTGAVWSILDGSFIEGAIIGASAEVLYLIYEEARKKPDQKPIGVHSTYDEELFGGLYIENEDISLDPY